MTRWSGAGRGRPGQIVLASLCTAKLALAEDAGLSIETGSPDALCPEIASTRAAVSRRLGALSLPDGSSGYRARYTIGHAPVGSPRDFVRLELFGPEGTLQLSRDLPLEGESCSTMAEVIALVLDRYFRAVLAGEPEEEPSPPAPVEASAAPPDAVPEAPLASTPAASTSAALAPTSSPDVPSVSGGEAAPHRLALVAFELAVRNPVQPALGARAMIELWPNIYLGAALHVGLVSDSQALPRGGEVSSRDATLRSYVAWGPQLGPVHTYIGPGFRLSLSRGTGRDLERLEVGYRASGAAGLDAGAIWVTDDGWSFGVTAALDISFAELGGRFYIDDEEVLVPKPLRGWVGMAVGHDF